MNYKGVVGFVAALGIAGYTASASTPSGASSTALAPVMHPVSTDRVAVPVARAAVQLSEGSAVSRESRVREVTLPAGTLLRLRLGSTVSSKTSSIEDPVQATVRSAITRNGVTIVPAGSAVSGYVTEARRSGRVKGRARVGVRFNALRVNGTLYNMRTSAIAREAQGTKKEDTAKIGIGAGAGAITGAIVDGKKGAAIGSAIGAAGGTGVVLATRGDEVSLGRGAAVTVRLTSPLTIRVAS
jgi:hypothetical protein